jgi:tetratricopeptide (TPR) repeat protein
LVVVIWGSCLAIGGVHPLTVAILALWVAALGLIHAKRRSARFSLGGWVLIALAAYTAAQCVPLPTAWLETLAPSSLLAWTDAATVLGSSLGKGAYPVSLDPDATRLESAKLLLYAAVWIQGAWFRQHYGLRASALVVFGLALTAICIGFLHFAADAERLYGVYAPDYASTTRLSPLLNPNNMAGLCTLGAFAGLAVAVHRKTRPRFAAAALLGVAVSSASTFVTGSRGGAAALTVGLLTFSAIALWRETRRACRASVPRTIWLRTGVHGLAVAALGVGFSALAMRAQLAAELWDDSLAKLSMLVWALDLALAHPWVGTGRGAFEAEAGRFHDFGGEQIFTHAENWPIEWISGWGLPVGGAAVVLLLAALWPRRSLRRPTLTRLAVYIGLVAVLAQNLLDLGLEVPGVAVPLTFLLSALLQVKSRPEAEGGQTDRGQKLALSGLGLAALTLASAVALLVVPPTLARVERKQLGLAFAAQSEPPALRLERVKGAVARHPGDGYLFRLGALAHVELGDSLTALGWLNASLRRAPQSGATHVLLAEALQRLGRTDQALAALRVAVEKTPALASEAARLGLTWDSSAILRVVPEGASGGLVLLSAARWSPVLQTRLDLAELAQARLPNDPKAHRLAAGARLELVEQGLAPCQGSPGDAAVEACLDKATSDLERARQLGNQDAGAEALDDRVAWGRLLLARGQYEEAYRELSEHCPVTRSGRECAGLLLKAALKLPTAELVAAADRLRDVHCASGSCAAIESELSAAFETRGEIHLALQHALRAASAEHSSARWLRAATLAERLDRRSQARQHLERAERDAAGEGPDALRAVERAKQQFAASLP